MREQCGNALMTMLEPRDTWNSISLKGSSDFGRAFDQSAPGKTKEGETAMVNALDADGLLRRFRDRYLCINDERCTSEAARTDLVLPQNLVVKTHLCIPVLYRV